MLKVTFPNALLRPVSVASMGQRSALTRYASAVVLTTLTTILTYILWAEHRSTISPLVLIGVLFVSWYGGMRPGLLAAALSAVACNLVFAQPAGALSLGADDLLRLATFMIGAIFVGALTMAGHQAEEAKLEAEKQLNITAKSIGEAVITTDAQGRIRSMNSIAQALTGWNQNEASGREIEEIFRMVDPETRRQVETVATRVLRDNVVLALGGPVYMISRDGSEVTVDQIATPVRDSRGQINEIVLVLRSVPDPRRKETTRLPAETIGLLDAVDANMFVVDLSGRCAFLSKSAAELLGYQSHEFDGRDIAELMNSSNRMDWSHTKNSWPHARDKDSFLTIETMRRRDGTTVPVGFSRAPLVVGELVAGTVVTITDLTERLRAAEALTRLESIANSIDEAIITHTADGTITSWNRAATKIYGYAEQEVIGRNVSITHPAGYEPELNPLFERILGRGRIEAFETVRLRKDGERVTVSINAVPINAGAAAQACIAQIVSDLTERKKAEEAALRANAELAAVNNRRLLTERAAKARDDRPVQIEGPIQEGAMPRTRGLVSRTERRGATALIGQSRLMSKLFATIERAAPTDTSVLITGATGTGKELVARAIHDRSPRSEGPFVDLNCSAIPEALIEAELFGHQRGTFTGAVENRMGLFEVASGGTLFLDEVDSLPLAAQAKLLRVLQEKRIRRVGGRINIDVDVRIISATNSDLTRAISEGRLRSDLFYRLRVFPIEVPELCQREGDIELLVDYFLERHATRHGTAWRRFTPEAMEALLQYGWPGNVRELENAVEYALAVASTEQLGLEDLPSEFAVRNGEGSGNPKSFLETYRKDGAPLAEIEKQYILSVLQQFDGNQVKAAAALGIDRSKLYRRLRQYGVKAVKFLQQEQRGGLYLISDRKDQAFRSEEGDSGNLADRASAYVG
jgi:PAS domain S-box-containing protein